MIALFQNSGVDAASENDKHEEELDLDSKSVSQGGSNSVGLISLHQKSVSSISGSGSEKPASC